MMQITIELGRGEIGVSVVHTADDDKLPVLAFEELKCGQPIGSESLHSEHTGSRVGVLIPNLKSLAVVQRCLTRIKRDLKKRLAERKENSSGR